MIHTARRRKREERRKKIGLNPKVNLNDSPTETPEKSEKTTKFNQGEKLDLEKSSYSNIFCSTLLAIDKNFSGSMAAVGENFPILNFCFNVCELLGNGVIWVGLTLYYLYNGRSEFAEHATNFLYGLILDIVTVATIKHIFKRSRPKKKSSTNSEESNSKEFDFGPDKYSFPSGHASRAVFIASFLTQEFKLRTVHRLLVMISTLWFILTRVWLGRHYLSDVCAGSVTGWAVYQTMTRLWLTRAQIQSFKYFFSYVLRLISFRA